MGKGEGKGRGKGGMMMMGFGGETDVVMRRESYGDRMSQACEQCYTLHRHSACGCSCPYRQYWSLRCAGCGVVAGPIIFVIGLWLIAWNEYRTVQTEKAIALGEEAMVEGNCDSLDAGLNNKLVFAACDLTRTGTDPLTYPVPPMLVADWISPVTSTTVSAAAAEMNAAWATSANPAIPATAVPLVMSAQAEVNGFVERESCRSHDSGGGSKTQTCTYTYEQTWMPCAADCRLQQEGWRNTNPSLEVQAQMQANSNANSGGRYRPGENPLAGSETVYVQDAFLGTAYPMTQATIGMISTRGSDQPGSGVRVPMPAVCAATTPWSTASSYIANCNAESSSLSLNCPLVQAADGVPCDPAAPAPPAPPPAPPGICSTTPNTQCTTASDQNTCEAIVGCLYVAASTAGGIQVPARCDTAEVPACGITAATQQECEGRGSCSFVPPPQGGVAGTCYFLPVARTNQCCLDGPTCGDTGMLNINLVGQRRASFTTTYGSDGTIVAQQRSDGSFTKWVPEDVDEAYSPWDYGSFGKKTKEQVILELYDENDFIKVCAPADCCCLHSSKLG
jgi:hypothetical protein